MCRSNSNTISKISGEGGLKEALSNGEVVTFSIVKANNFNKIPENQFCEWSLLIDPELTYSLQIKRDFYPVREQIEVTMIGSDKKQQVRDEEL